MDVYLGEKIEYISNMGQVLLNKFSVEKRMNGLHMQLGVALGAAILSIEGNLPVERTAELFSIELNEVEKRKKSSNPPETSIHQSKSLWNWLKNSHQWVVFLERRNLC